MPALAATIRQAAAEATLQFDWLLPADRPMLRIAEIATATGMRSTFLEEWFAEKCHRYGADQRTRPAMRIPRAFAIELLVQSAKYTPADKLEAVQSLAREFTAEECEQIAAHFRATAAKKPLSR